MGGLWVTIQLTGIIWAIGLILGGVLGVLGAQWKLSLGSASRTVEFLLSSVPVLVFLFWVHYPLPVILDSRWSPFASAAATFSVVNVFGVASVIRGSLVEFPGEYRIAAQVSGLNRRDTIVFIELPIIARQVIPPLLVLQINMLQMTLFASLISVNELFRVAQRINAFVYRPVQIYTALAVFYLAICFPVNWFAARLRARFRRLSEE